MATFQGIFPTFSWMAHREAATIVINNNCCARFWTRPAADLAYNDVISPPENP